jgi:spore coat protein CotF
MPISGQNTGNNQPKQGQIKNPQTDQLPIVKGPEMNERDYMNDILATEKYLTDNLNIFTREASNQELHEEIVTLLNETHVAARNLFNEMFKKGWYGLTAADQQEIQQTAEQFQNYQTQQPY